MCHSYKSCTHDPRGKSSADLKPSSLPPSADCIPNEPLFLGERERGIIKRKKKNTIGEKREADEEHMLTEMTQRREEGLPAT